MLAKLNLTLFNLDIYTSTSYFVIYQLWLSEDLVLTRQKVNISQSNQVASYYLARAKGNFNETILVHRDKKELLESFPPLFTSLPVGFLHSSNMYLFDSSSACVIVVHLPKPNLDLFEEYQKSSLNLIFRRTNIPYERFFNCLLPATLSAENRCNTLEGPNSFTASYIKSIAVASIVGLLLLFITCFSALYFVYFKTNEKKGKLRS